jgi:hypothetical protein
MGWAGEPENLFLGNESMILWSTDGIVVDLAGKRKVKWAWLLVSKKVWLGWNTAVCSTGKKALQYICIAEKTETKYSGSVRSTFNLLVSRRFARVVSAARVCRGVVVSDIRFGFVRSRDPFLTRVPYALQKTVDEVYACALKVYLRSVLRSASVYSTIGWAFTTQSDTLDILVTCFVVKLVDIPVLITGRWYFANSRKISNDIVNVRVLPLLFVDAWKVQGGMETAFA